MGEHAPYAVFFDNIELGDDQVLGEVGKGFAPMQNRLGVRRMEIACRSLGYARRCMDLMLKQANERKTFGALLAERQQQLARQKGDQNAVEPGYKSENKEKYADY